jgi:hypothetical protein
VKDRHGLQDIGGTKVSKSILLPAHFEIRIGNSTTSFKNSFRAPLNLHPDDASLKADRRLQNRNNFLGNSSPAHYYMP